MAAIQFTIRRARYRLIRDILTSTPNRETIYTKLVNIGSEAYADCIKVLKATHRQLRDSGTFGKIYNAENNVFN